MTRRNGSGGFRTRKLRLFTPFPQPPAPGLIQIDFKGKQGRSFAIERAESSEKLMPAATEHIRTLQGLGKRVIVACWTNGARERLGAMFGAHGIKEIEKVATIADARKAAKSAICFALLGLESGFETPDLGIVAEQDILGDRLIRRRRAKKASDVLIEASSLTPGDLMVHADHGIGRFIGLKTIDAAGAPHDCVELEYAGGDKLFLPIENMELLTRYGSGEDGAALDKLGGASLAGPQGAAQAAHPRNGRGAYQGGGRCARPSPRQSSRCPKALIPSSWRASPTMKPTTSSRASRPLPRTWPRAGRWTGSFAAMWVSARPRSRLRAAFIAVMEGKQVAVVVPTTLLARQHFQTFTERFRGFPVKIAQASRLVSAKDMSRMREELKNGQVDIVVGTHALLAKSIEFKDLGLLIVDEEQHFGVAHKERLKQLREDVHVLTLTATPIPRTLQLALTGVREMSVIATPPVDRLAVRTFITPFDPVTLREALLARAVSRRAELLRRAAHLRPGRCGRLPARAGARSALHAGAWANVAVAARRHHGRVLRQAVRRAALDDHRGIRARYPEREHADRTPRRYVRARRALPAPGRVGRSKTRAYAMFTIPPNGKITAQAEKRLKVLHSLDSLGAGFTLASHDLDLRGAGNLLGEEQSGHIKEVGYELYQSMLEEAVKSLKEHGAEDQEEQWSPTINVGLPVLLPEPYVPDLQVRLGLYRRLSGLHESADLENFSASWRIASDRCRRR